MEKHNNTPKRKTVALYGGSFNPPHEGHFEMAKYIYDTVKPDSVWFLYSDNVWKDPDSYAPLKHRIKMGEIMAQEYPDYPFVMSDFQHQIGKHMTFDVLTALREKHPDTNFIWVMGADNLAVFHQWDGYEDIIATTPIAVVDRKGYTQDALNSYAALTYRHLQTDNAEDLGKNPQGWCFLTPPHIDIASSQLLLALRAGQTDFKGTFQTVANYIHENNLYDVPTANANTPKATSRPPHKKSRHYRP